MADYSDSRLEPLTTLRGDLRAHVRQHIAAAHIQEWLDLCGMAADPYHSVIYKTDLPRCPLCMAVNAAIDAVNEVLEAAAAELQEADAKASAGAVE